MADTIDNGVTEFQKWFNKKYGMPEIAVDGMMSIGTKEAYANHGKDYINEIKAKNKKVNTDLQNSLTDSMKKVTELQTNSVTKKRMYIMVGCGLVIGLAIGLITKK